MMFTYCRQENAIVSHHLHRTWEGYFRGSLYCCTYSVRYNMPTDADSAEELLRIHNHKFSFEVTNNGHHHHWTNSPEPKYDARVRART